MADQPAARILTDPQHGDSAAEGMQRSPPTAGAGVDEGVGAQRLDLFPTIAWVADLAPDLADVRQQLVEDAWDFLGHPVEGQPGLQTPGTLQQRMEPWWSQCFEAITAFTDLIAESLRPQWQERKIFSWALGYRSRADYLSGFGKNEQEAEDHLRLEALGFGHTHTAATFTSILYLQIPDGMTGTGATVIRDPQYPLHRRLGGETEFRFFPRALQLLVFPGYLEHHPAIVDLPEPWSSPRLIVSTDVCYY